MKQSILDVQGLPFWVEFLVEYVIFQPKLVSTIQLYVWI